MESRGQHFLDAFAASLLGAAAYDAIKSAWRTDSEQDVANVRVFQRSLIIAVESGALDPDAADRYLNRIAALSPARRPQYIHRILQPPSGPPNDRQTAVVVRDHALMSDPTWNSIVAVLGVEQPRSLESLDAWLSKTADEMRAKTERMVAARHKRENASLPMKIWYLFSRALKLPWEE